QGSSAILPNNSKSIAEYNYSKIDNHALNAPSSAEVSIENLTTYLVAPARNEREKARAIFRWIAENIDYNVEGYFSGSFGAEDANDLLKSRKSVCDGYSDLFESLAKEAGLEAVRIAGYGKGYGYAPGQNISGESNHAWNAVKINGSWYLVDCTWGAGYINEDKKYVREFDEHYFMTPPGEFVYDHFPDDSLWQLMEMPISTSEFEKLAYVRSGFFNYGLRLGNHLEGMIDADKNVNISIYAPEDVLLIAKLEYANGKGSASGTDLESYSFVQKEKDRYDILVKLPSAGRYVLRAYAKHKGDPGEYNGVLEYGIAATSGSGVNAGFPMVYGKFTETGAYLYGPMDGRLKVGVPQRFKLRVPGALNVSVINGDKWYDLSSRGNLFEGNMTPAKGDVTVCARFAGEKWDGMVKYTGY
ncbi:MAG: hypothetical protein EHM14_12265, partial [Methanothrix sp.]